MKKLIMTISIVAVLGMSAFAHAREACIYTGTGEVYCGTVLE